MTDTRTPPPEVDAAVATERRISRPRRLPGGRAVVGAMLVAAAAVAVFAAYLDATADGSTPYLVAATEVAAGTVIEDLPTARAHFTSTALTLHEPVAGRAVTAAELEELVGRTVAVPLAAGELLQRSALVAADRRPETHVMSFAVPLAGAVGGSVRPGETIDVVATDGRGGQARTGYVVRGVPVLDVETGGTGTTVVLTVALAEPAQVQALGHAVSTADVFVVSTTTVGDHGEFPPPFPAPASPGDEGADGG